MICSKYVFSSHINFNSLRFAICQNSDMKHIFYCYCCCYHYHYKCIILCFYLIFLSLLCKSNEQIHFIQFRISLFFLFYFNQFEFRNTVFILFHYPSCQLLLSVYIHGYWLPLLFILVLSHVCTCT